MGFFDDALDGFFDKGLELGLDLVSGSSNRTGKKQTVGEAFTARRVVYGEHLVAGTIVLADASGDYYDNKDFLTVVCVLATQHSDFIREVRFDDVKVMDGIENAHEHYNSFTWVDGASDSDKLLLGQSRIDARTELAYQRAHLGESGSRIAGGVYQYLNDSGDWAILGDDVAGGITKGFANSVYSFYGLTAVYLRLKYSETFYPSGIPNMSFLMRGKLVHDPRIDSTAYSQNFALAALDYLKNILRIPDNRLDLQTFIDAADICDEGVATINGETEKRFTINGILELDKSPLENLETLLASAGAWLSYVQGKWQLFLPVYTAPVLTLSESDLAGSIQFQPKSSKQNRINIAKGSYISPENDYERVEAPTIRNASYIANDGEELENTFDYELVTSGYQVQRLNKIKLEQSRYGVTLTAVFKFKALEVTVGDRVTLSISNFGWTNKVFQVLKLEADFESGVKLTLREDAESIYSWTAGEAIELEAPPALNLPDHSDILAPDSLTLIEELYQTNNTREIKARAILEWTANEGGNYKYDLEIKEASETDWVSIMSRYRGSRAVVNDIAPANYDIRVRSINGVGFESDWLQINQTIAGKTAPPPDVDSVFVDGGILTWTYSNPPIDLAGFEVRSHDGARQTWADAQQLHSGVVSSSRFSLPSSIGGTKTFLVKALDTTGNYSDSAAIATVGLGDPSVANVVITHDYKAGGWVGTLSNGSISGSNELEADQVGSFYNPDGGSIYYSQDGSSLFYDSEFKKLSYEFTYTVAAIDEGSQLTIAASVVGESYQVEFIPPSVGGSVYSTFQGYIQSVEAGQYKFKISIPSQFGSTVPKITALDLNLDVPDVTEAIEDFSVSSSGSRLPITKAYRGIGYVTLTMQTDGSGVASLKIDDKNHTLGPLVYAYNSSGTAVNTTIDAFIRGY